MVSFVFILILNDISNIEDLELWSQEYIWLSSLYLYLWLMESIMLYT